MFKTWMSRLFGFVKPAICRHEFAYEDLHQTGIQEPDKPKTNSYDEWLEWHKNFYLSDHVTKRVEWPCARCGKVFFAHCGLDVLHHGTAFWRTK